VDQLLQASVVGDRIAFRSTGTQGLKQVEGNIHNSNISRQESRRGVHTLRIEVTEHVQPAIPPGLITEYSHM
jgi:hypothetical protein